MLRFLLLSHHLPAGRAVQDPTPALLRTGEDGPKAVLYGDFSDAVSLMRFLSEL